MRTVQTYPCEKSARRQYQGALNRAAGRTFEGLIEEALLYYAQRGEALIEKTPEPMHPTKDLGGGKFVAYYEKQAQPDYKGALKNGRAVVFEAKHTMGDRIEQSRVTPTQTAALNGYAQMGAECFVVVGFDMQYFYRIPWSIFRNMKERWGRKYVTPADLHEFSVPVGPMGQLLIL